MINMMLLLLSLAAEARELPDVSAVDSQVQQQALRLARGLQGAFLVGKEGRVLAAGGLGKANRRTGEDNGVHTSLRLASVSKPLTATAVMQLYDRGLVDLDDMVSDHLPDYGPNGRRIRVRHLLTHSSGIPDYVESVSSPASSQELIDAFRSRPLEFTPGTRMEYSNSNFALLGYLVERITGKPYGTYMEENIFRRALMRRSGAEFPRIPGPGFGAPSGGNPNGPWEPNSKAYAAGALYSTVADMAYYNHALMEGWLVKPGTVNLMHTAVIDKAGLGCFVDGQWVSHSGMIPGFTAQLYLRPSVRGIVIVLSNGGLDAPTVASRLKSLIGS